LIPVSKKWGIFLTFAGFIYKKAILYPAPVTSARHRCAVPLPHGRGRTLLHQVPHSAEKDADGYSLLLEIIKNGEGNPEW